MSNIEKYVNKILTTVKPLTVENIVEFCKKELIKYYSDSKLHNLEIAKDYVIENYVKNSLTYSESNEQLPF